MFGNPVQAPSVLPPTSTLRIGRHKYLAESRAVRSLAETPTQTLLADHLDQQREVQLQNVLRVLSIEDRSGRMRIISRGLMSADPRRRANSQEALDDLLERSLTRILLPLLDDGPPEKVLAIGRREFRIADYSRDAAGLYDHLLKRDDDLTVLLTLQLMAERQLKVNPLSLDPLTRHANPLIRDLACRMAKKDIGWPHKGSMFLSDVILLLKKIEIFTQLTVSELAAVASVSREVAFPGDHTVIHEGDAGDTLHLIIEGSVIVRKKKDGGGEIELDRMAVGDYFCLLSAKRVEDRRRTQIRE